MEVLYKWTEIIYVNKTYLKLLGVGGEHVCLANTSLYLLYSLYALEYILMPNMKKRKLEDREETFQGTKVFVMPNGMLKSNQQLVDIIEKVKPEIRLLIEKCNTVKMWVQLLIPRIEDGNNFGVSIQEETVAELRTVESEAASYLDQISRYYITRAKLVSKIAKYPHVEDYRRTVTEIDEKEYISLRLIISELRNQYVTLHDMILKNIEKIKRPRSSNAETLY